MDHSEEKKRPMDRTHGKARRAHKDDTGRCAASGRLRNEYLNQGSMRISRDGKLLQTNRLDVRPKKEKNEQNAMKFLQRNMVMVLGGTF